MAWNQTVYNPMNHPDLFRAGGSATQVPSFVPPQELKLFDLVDHFAARRAALEDEQRKQALDEHKNAYYEGKVAQQERRDEANRNYQDMKLLHDSLSSHRRQAAAGQRPSDIVTRGPDGSPIVVQWSRRTKGGPPTARPTDAPEPAPAEQPAAGQQLSMPDLGQSMGQAPAPLSQQLRMPQLSGGPLPQMSATPPSRVEGFRQDTPPEPAPQPQRNTVFYDENNDGTVQALTGQGDQTTVNLPERAFPEGAKEGDRFDAADVNMRGGYGNPFAGPVEPSPLPDVQRQPMAGGPLQSDAMRAPEVRGERVQMPAQGGDSFVWEAKLPNGQVLTIDPEEERMAMQAESSSKVRDIDRALQDDMIPENQKRQLLSIRPLVMSGLDPRLALEMTRANEAQKLEGDKQGGRKELQGEALASKEKLAAEKNQTTLEAAKLRKRGGGSGRVVVQSSGQGSAFSRLKPTEQYRIDSAVRNGISLFDREMNWNKLEGIGMDRLDLALSNIRARGALGGTQQMEAMMNFFGYIRGGVPAKNETDEWKRTTGTIWTFLDRMGIKASNFDNGTGTPEDREAFAKGVGALPPAQRASLEQAIVESKKQIIGFAQKNIAAQAEGFKSASTAMHERAQDAFNSKLRFIGGQPRQWYADSPLLPDFEAGAQAPAAGGRPASKPADLNDLVRALP